VTTNVHGYINLAMNFETVICQLWYLLPNSLYGAENLKWLTELREWKTYKNV